MDYAREIVDTGPKKGYHIFNDLKGVISMKKSDAATLGKLLLTPVLMIILGIALILRPDSASALVGKILGWVFILAGVAMAVESLAVRDISTGRVLFSVVALALGVWLIRNPLRLAAALGRIAGLVILLRSIQDIINATRWKCGMKYALLSGIIGALLILLPMTSSRAIWVILGILVTVVGILTAVDRVKFGRGLPSGDDNIIDAQ